MKLFYTLCKATRVAMYVLICTLALTAFSGKVNAQCTTGSKVAKITPTTVFQSLSVPAGAGDYWTFDATAGNTYTFSFCTTDGGSASFDSYLTLANIIFNNVNVIIASNGGCNGDDAIITWDATLDGTYRIYPTQFSPFSLGCVARSTVSTLVYKKFPTCSTPVSSGATAISTTGATANWTGGTGSYIIEYGLTGFTPGLGAAAGSGSSTVVTSLAGTTAKAITGLTADSNYQYYVRQVCSGPTYTANSTVQSFSTLFDPCGTITNISACGVSTSTTIASGTGAYSANTCGFSTPGKEKIYIFTPATTSLYNIAQTASFDYIDYQYKPVSGGCSGTGWTCIKNLNGASTSTTNPILTAGTQYYIMLDPESSLGGTVTFSIVCAPAGCSGTPNGGFVQASSSAICLGITSATLSLSGVTSGPGITYQWQSSPNNSSFANISLATSATLSVTPTASTYYRCLVTCTNSALSANSSAWLINVLEPTYAVYNGTLYSESFELWITRCVSLDIPTAAWRNKPIYGNDSWRRDDQGGFAGWSSASGAYSPVSSAGAHSARFHSSNASLSTMGSLELYINLSAAPGPTDLQFDYVNTSGTDVLKVWQSTDGGSTFTQIGSSLTTSATFTTKTFTLTSTSATTVIRLEATSDLGATDIGIDNLKIAPCTATASINPSADTICAGQSVTLNENGGTATSWSWTGGATTQSISVSPAVTTTYTVTATKAPGCSTATASATVTVNVIPTGVTAGASATSICEGTAINLTSSANPYSTTALSQTFNSGLGTWTTVNGSTGGINASAAAWTLRPNGYTYNIAFNSNDNSQFMLTNSQAQGFGGTTDTELRSPAFSTVGYTTLNLSFYHCYRPFSGDMARVDVSTNGTIWTTVKTYSTTQGVENSFANDNINLNAYIGNATLFVRFKYTASNDAWWAIDNVSITGTPIVKTFAWTSTPAGFTSSLQNPTGVTPSVNTTYTVTVSYNANSCTAQASTSQVTVTPTTTSEETQTACDSYTWNGTLYTSSGDKTFVSGCNTATLHLTITPSTTTEETQTACGSYTWNGTLYTSSGDKTFVSGCNTTTLHLTISAAAPPKPGNITGQIFNLCGGGLFSYTIPATPGATSYIWAITGSGTSVSGTGTTGSVILPPTFTGIVQLSVIAVNGCGQGPVRKIKLYAVRSNPSSSIDGPISVTSGQTNVIYKLPNTAGFSYAWTVPAGATITSGQGTYKIKVTFGANSGNVQVIVSNACGSAPTGSLSVSVVPLIIASGSLTDQTTTANAYFKAFPNPASTKTTVVFSALKKDAKFEIRISDVNSKALITRTGVTVAGENRMNFEMGQYANGMYLVTLIADDKVQILKLYKVK